MIEKKILEPLFKTVLAAIGAPEDIEVSFEKPANPEHGNVSTNLAMKLAKPLKKSPKAIAEEIIEKLESSDFIERIDVAGAGFINIKLKNIFYIEQFSELAKTKSDIGKNNSGNGKRINVEYVSVNPTGLLHLGHGRNAAIGDTIANLYEWNGWSVTREFYFNNAGFQMQMLAKSIYARYRQHLGDKDFPFPEDGYHGDYIATIAAEIAQSHGDSLKAGTEDDILACRKIGERWCFERIKATLETMNVEQDLFYNEDSLYSEGKIDKLIADLKSRNLVYEKDGALWLKLSEMGLKDDRVIVKSTGEPTYRLPDIAYHREKFERGFDLMVDILGADLSQPIPMFWLQSKR
jgi:arginyl-tRNA synthetase